MVVYHILGDDAIETEEYQGATSIPFDMAFIYAVDGYRYDTEPQFGAIVLALDSKLVGILEE